MAIPVLLTDVADGCVRLTLNRPDRLNAMTPELHGQLTEALEQARDDATCRVIILTGAGRGFCAGQDLGQRDPTNSDEPVDLGESLDTLYNPLIKLIRSIPKPVICAVNGVAAGAGANMALACDIVVAARSAKFIQAFSKIGLIPDSGGTWMLPRLIGEARAKALAFTAQPLSAEQAVAWGLIWQVVDDERLQVVVNAMASEYSTAATVGLALTKEAMHSAHQNTLEEQLDLERDLQRRAGRTADYAEGVSAFLGKRKPKFHGIE